MSFTYEYSQPHEYHFSLDSIQAPEMIAQKLLKGDLSGRPTAGFSRALKDWKVLDLCAGCGVMGFELSFHVRDLRHFDFVEVQEIYREHFDRNVAIVGRPEVQFRFHLQNYAEFTSAAGGYDLIIANPPYFRVGQGKMSPSDFKNRCRFFIDSDFPHLIEAILRLRRPGGRAYLLLRPLADHGRSILQELENILRGRAQFKIEADIRGTDLISIF